MMDTTSFIDEAEQLPRQRRAHVVGMMPFFISNSFSFTFVVDFSTYPCKLTTSFVKSWKWVTVVEV